MINKIKRQNYSRSSFFSLFVNSSSSFFIDLSLTLVSSQIMMPFFCSISQLPRFFAEIVVLGPWRKWELYDPGCHDGTHSRIGPTGAIKDRSSARSKEIYLWNTHHCPPPKLAYKSSLFQQPCYN